MSRANQEMIPLAERARRLKQGWRATWDMVLRGELPAERTSGGPISGGLAVGASLLLQEHGGALLPGGRTGPRGPYRARKLK